MFPVFAVVVAGCGGCGKSAPELAGGDSGLASVPTPPAIRLPRDDAGHLIPRSLPPPEPGDAGPPKPRREPDWDLGSDDAASEYVNRYVVATHRYGDAVECMRVEASLPSGDKRSVSVRVRRDRPACKDPGVVRDVFLVDVAADRLSLVHDGSPSPLARWPDGSDPEGPPGEVRAVDDLRVWKGDLRDVLGKQMQLVPIRAQLYGRGSYPVVTIAGWHGDVVANAPRDKLDAAAAKMCKANDAMPLALFAGLDRSSILRVRCPGSARWEKL